MPARPAAVRLDFGTGPVPTGETVSAERTGCSA